MSRVHDMGGRFGDGAITPATGEPIFAENWHARALALTLAAGALGQWNLDISRHARECLSPKDYVRFSYYEKWLAGLADLLVAQGVVTPEELGGAAALPSDLQKRKLLAEKVASVLASGGPTSRGAAEPRFALGDTVRARARAANAYVPGGHTRLPQYAAGAVGEVVRLHGGHILPDAHAHGMGEAPEPLYTIAFPAAALWAAPEHPGDLVSCELWESYLEPIS